MHRLIRYQRLRIRRRMQGTESTYGEFRHLRQLRVQPVLTLVNTKTV